LRRSTLALSVLLAALAGCRDAPRTFDTTDLPAGLVTTRKIESVTVDYRQGKPGSTAGAPILDSLLLGEGQDSLSVSYDAGAGRLRFSIEKVATGQTLLELLIPEDRVTATLEDGRKLPFSAALSRVVSLDVEILGDVPLPQSDSVPGCAISVARTVVLSVERDRIDFSLAGVESWDDTAEVLQDGVSTELGQSSCGALLAAQSGALGDPELKAAGALEQALSAGSLDLDRLRFVRSITHRLDVGSGPAEAEPGSSESESESEREGDAGTLSADAGSSAPARSPEAPNAPALPEILLNDAEGTLVRTAFPIF
jgi:hypothetical protein